MSQQINLFDPELNPHNSSLNLKNLLWCFLFILVLGGGLHFYLKHISLQAQSLLDASASQLKTMNTEMQALRQAQVPNIANAKLDAELGELLAAVQRRQQIAAILQSTDFGNTVGYSSYLTAFARQIPANVWITGLRIQGAGHDLQVEGRTSQAELVPVFVAQLKREKIMQGKTFAALKLERPQVIDKGDLSTEKKGRKDELATFLEFELHSMEEKVPVATAGVKVP